MDTEVLFEKVRDNKNYRFKICKILPENLKETYDLYESVFYKYEPVTACLNYDKELFEKFYTSSIELYIKNELCYMIQDMDQNNEIVAIMINYDHFEGVYQSPDGEWQPKEIIDLEYENDSVPASGTGEVLYLELMVCKKEYWGMGLMSKLTNYVINDAPICKDFQKFFAICTNLGSITVCERLGFVNISRVRFDEYKNNEGVNPFANLKDIAERMEIKGAEESCVLLFVKSQE